MRVYIAGPYTLNGEALNVRRAIDAAEQVLNAGHWPFVPHLTHFWHMIYEHDYATWLSLDGVWLAQCEALIRLPGESKGADLEVTMAVAHGLPVFYSVESFLDAVALGL